MALVKCSECGKEISDKADVCMNCGSPVEKSFNKEYKDLSKKEKILVGKEIKKDEGYKSFSIFLTAFSLVGMLISFITMNYFLMWLFIFLDVILGICLNIYMKKFYKKNLYYADNKYSKNEPKLNVEQDKINIIKEKESKQENVKSYNKWFLVIIIGCIIIAMFIFFYRTGRIIKKWNRVLVYYDLAKNICCLLPCIMLLLSYFYDKTRKVILKKIVKIISIISIAMSLMFLCYWWFNVIPQNNGWSIYNYDTDFIFYNLLLIVANYMIIQKIDKMRK